MNKQVMGVNVGIDVGKFQPDVFIWERDRHFTVESNEQGIHECHPGFQSLQDSMHCYGSKRSL